MKPKTKLIKFTTILTIWVLALASHVSASAAQMPKVLVILSSESELALRDGKIYPTGYYLNELTIPVRKMTEEGYEITFANPKGNAPQLDRRSDSVKYFENNEALYQSYKKFHNQLTALQSPHKLSDIIEQGLDKYSAVFFPGGHAPMIDLIHNKEVGVILNHFHQAGKPTALICHGPIALISTVKDPNAFIASLKEGNEKEAAKLAENWPYAGYKMTIFSTAEEEIAEKNGLKGKLLFYPAFALKAAGGTLILGKAWSPNVIKDRELITGQNPGSDKRFVEILIDSIDSQKVSQ